MKKSKRKNSRNRCTNESAPPPQNSGIDMSILNKYQDKPQEGNMKQSFADFMKENPEAKADVLAFAEKEKPPAPAAPAAAVVATDPADGVRVSEILALAGVVLSAEIKAAIADPKITPEKFAYEAMKKKHRRAREAERRRARFSHRRRADPRRTVGRAFRQDDRRARRRNRRGRTPQAVKKSKRR